MAVPPAAAAAQALASSSEAEEALRARYNALMRGFLADVSMEDNAGAKGILKRLISHGADFNLKDDEGNHVLHRLCKHEELDLDLFRRVLATNIDVEAVNGEGHRALHLVFTSLGQYEDPTYYDDMTARKKALRLLLDKGVNINAKNGKGRPFLVCLCVQALDLKPLVPVIRDVIRHGADVRAADKNGRTALHELGIYEARCVIELAFMLLDRGADLHARDNEGRTPLHYTSRDEVARRMINEGADPDAIDDAGIKPIAHALFHFEVGDVAAMLMQFTADLEGSILRGAECRFRSILREEDPDGSKLRARIIDYCDSILEKPMKALLRPAVPIPPFRRGFARWAVTSPIGLEILERTRVGIAARQAGRLEGELESSSDEDDSDSSSSSSSSSSDDDDAGIVEGGGAGAAADNRLRDLKLKDLKEDGWQRRRHLVCCYVKTREARRGGAAKKPKGEGSAASEDA